MFRYPANVTQIRYGINKADANLLIGCADMMHAKIANHSTIRQIKALI